MSLELVNSIIIETIEETNNENSTKFDLNDDLNNNSIKFITPVLSDITIEGPKIILSPCNESMDIATPTSPTSFNLSSSFRIKV
jgi:hypothetical protein